MSYPLENETSLILNDVFRRKEYYQHKLTGYKTNDIVPRFMLDKMIRDENYLQFHSYQLFVSNYMNPNTPNSRLLMKWQTGSGKSIGALSIAMNFIKYYQMEELNGSEQIGSVFIVGFTSHVFKKELLRFPEFGIITKEELAKLNKLKKIAYSGSKFDVENLRDFSAKIRKKFNNREGNGFFRFIGYKELVNKIFIVDSNTTDLKSLDEDGIRKAIDDGRIKLNKALLEEFKNSLVICDEIHNVYNSADKNNWGIALQYVLDSHPSIRAVFMSATPINNVPSEIIDLLNLLLPKKYYETLHKEDFFDKDKKLLRGALDKIAELCKGRISYVRDDNPAYFPSKKMIGESIPNAPYLKFIRCPMSEFHYKTYKHAYSEEPTKDTQYIVDFAILNPENPNIGLFQTTEIKKIAHAPQSWKDKNRIGFQKEKIVGDILKLKNLPVIANKYAKMMETINEIIKTQSGKMFVYHNVIHMSGVLFIQEILSRNHIIGEFADSTDNTLCSVCGKPRKEHKNASGGAIEKEEKTIKLLKDNDYTAMYNYTTRSYQVLKSDSLSDFDPKVPHSGSFKVLEYKLIDNIIYVETIFANRFMLGDVAEIMKILDKAGYVIVKHLKSNPHHLYGLKPFKKFAVVSLDGRVYDYYTNNDAIDAKDDLQNIKRLRVKRGGQRGGQRMNHTFMPVRFITFHSELDKSAMGNSLEKFNSPDNADGHRIMLLIGGKLIKEAYDIKAIRELMVMGRPDNIPTLIQILGRAVRKDSHKDLPPEKRNVNIRIFTTCIPEKKNGIYKTSREEDKYIEKLGYYKVIQDIEKTLHENAVDAMINRDIIWRTKLEEKSEPRLGSLYYEPSLAKSIKDNTFSLNELNLQTFNAFHMNTEIDNIVVIIKKLFVARSPVWTYANLLSAVKNARKYTKVEFNTGLISEESFNVALSRLVWAKNNEYVEPFIHSQDRIDNVLDKIFDSEDKMIMLPSGQKSVITQVGLYYMLFPLDEVSDTPMQVAGLPYRIVKQEKPTILNVRSFLEKGDSLESYKDKRDRFFARWNNVDIKKLELAVCDFGTNFHIMFLEESIKYIFDVWTNPKIKKEFMHVFYFKMVNYYDLRGLVVWGHTAKSYMFKKYENMLKPVVVKVKESKSLKGSQGDTLKVQDSKSTTSKSNSGKPTRVQDDTSGILNMLKSSLNKSDLNWVSSGLKNKFEETVDASLKMFDGQYKKLSMRKGKVNADLVPIGHFLDINPKFYHPNEDWSNNPEYLDFNNNYVENDILVGYDERSKTGVHIRFKIRTPIQNIEKHKDSRLIEKGSICTSKSKTYLRDIAKKLGIKVKDKVNVNKLCRDIRTKLIYFELKEREAKSNKKFFYFIYERRPETANI